MRFPLLAALAVAASLVFGVGSSLAEDATAYVPQKGDDVVVYTHRFKPENFEEGLKLAKEGFTSAQIAAGQTRLNYIIVNPASFEVVFISVFKPGSSVEEWHKFMGRLDLLKKLDPMRSEPLKVQRYVFEAVTKAP